jgi:hypothetical protein
VQEVLVARQYRKPKFFNRVHTGYDWNIKHNRAHYDADNPP